MTTNNSVYGIDRDQIIGVYGFKWLFVEIGRGIFYITSGEKRIFEFKFESWRRFRAWFIFGHLSIGMNWLRFKTIDEIIGCPREDIPGPTSTLEEWEYFTIRCLRKLNKKLILKNKEVVADQAHIEKLEDRLKRVRAKMAKRSVTQT